MSRDPERENASSIDTAYGNANTDEALTNREKPAVPTTEEDDPNLIGWDRPDDPMNPMNWPKSKKWFNIVVLSILTIITYAFSLPSRVALVSFDHVLTIF